MNCTDGGRGGKYEKAQRTGESCKFLCPKIKYRSQVERQNTAEKCSDLAITRTQRPTPLWSGTLRFTRVSTLLHCKPAVLKCYNVAALMLQCYSIVATMLHTALQLPKPATLSSPFYSHISYITATVTPSGTKAL